MHVFITSSPFVENADRAILSNRNSFIDRIRDCLPPEPRALFICSNPEDSHGTARFGADAVSAFNLADIPFRSYSILDGSNADDAPWLIGDADFIILAGGHVPTQNDFFKDLELRELLEGFDGTVMGISAGSMNMADTVYIQPEEPGESSPDFPRFAPGLGLTDVNILPHYQKVRGYMLDGLRLFEDITYADSDGQTFFALPDNSYFYQDEECLLLCGEGYCIRDGQIEQICEDGQELDMSEF